MERLEERRRRIKPDRPAAQRIGLSATQRPLDEVARLLGGADLDPTVTDTANDSAFRPRDVTIVEAGRKRELDITIEVPVEDMSQLAEAQPKKQTGKARQRDPQPAISSIWPAIHPRLVELIRSHRSTMIFVNSRRLAERLAGAINDEAGEEIALAHHGSLAKDARFDIESRLKQGQLPAIVATSSLELGIDMPCSQRVFDVVRFQIVGGKSRLYLNQDGSQFFIADDFRIVVQRLDDERFSPFDLCRAEFDFAGDDLGESFGLSRRECQPTGCEGSAGHQLNGQEACHF